MGRMQPGSERWSRPRTQLLQLPLPRSEPRAAAANGRIKLPRPLLKSGATADISEHLESALLFSGLRELQPLYSEPQPFFSLRLANRLLCLVEALISILAAFGCISFGHGDGICNRTNTYS